jgi:hypothetical protein
MNVGDRVSKRLAVPVDMHDVSRELAVDLIAVSALVKPRPSI